MNLLTHVKSGLLRDPVCHEDDWEGVRPWPRPLLAGRMTAHRSKKEAKKNVFRR